MKNYFCPLKIRNQNQEKIACLMIILLRGPFKTLTLCLSLLRICFHKAKLFPLVPKRCTTPDETSDPGVYF